MSYTEETSHPSPVFHWFNLISQTDLFVCMLTEMQRTNRTVCLGVCVVMGCVVTVHFFSFSFRQMSVIFPALSSSALVSEYKRWSPTALLTLLRICSLTFVHIHTRSSFAILLFVFCQESALARGWPSREIERGVCVKSTVQSAVHNWAMWDYTHQNRANQTGCEQTLCACH